MRTLKITCWNVNGLYRKSSDYCKLEDEGFLDSVLGYDIIGLVETHAAPEDNISLEGYHTFQVNRPKHKRAHKLSGGLAVLIKKDIKKGITLARSGMFAIWLKVDRLFSGYKSDIYICITYLPPENSSYYRQLNINCIDILEKQNTAFLSSR